MHEQRPIRAYDVRRTSQRKDGGGWSLKKALVSRWASLSFRAIADTKKHEGKLNQASNTIHIACTVLISFFIICHLFINEISWHTLLHVAKFHFSFIYLLQYRLTNFLYNRHEDNNFKFKYSLCVCAHEREVCVNVWVCVSTRVCVCVCVHIHLCLCI